MSGAVVFIIFATLGFAASSPLLAWRDPIYIVAGFAGILALSLMVVQPLLAAGLLGARHIATNRNWHRNLGFVLVLLVASHVIGLWVTSPPDVIDALLFISPTPFSAWGVVAMWAVFIAALMAVFRRSLALAPRVWRRMHTFVVGFAVSTTAAHALLIEGAMEFVTKTTICASAVLATFTMIFHLGAWKRSRK